MFFKNVDFLTPKITLYYNRKSSHSSIISGILTIISYLSIFVFGIIYVSKCINRDNPTTYYFNKYVDDVGVFSFNDPVNFFNFIQVINGVNRSNMYPDFDKIEILGVNTSINGFINQGGKERIAHWLYGRCDEESNIKGVEHLLDKQSFYKSTCIKKFYNPSKGRYFDINDDDFEWPYLSLRGANKNNSGYGTIVKRCENSTFRLNKFGPCSTEKEIEKYLERSYFIFTTLDNYVDILTYKNPIKTFLYSVTCGFLEESYITNNLNFNPGLIKSYDNLFSDYSSEQITYFFSENSRLTTLLEQKSFLTAFFISFDNCQIYYERHYQKIFDVFSKIGGLSSLILIIAEWLNYIVFRFNVLLDTKNLLTNIIKKNESIYNVFAPSKNIKFISENNMRKSKNNLNKVLKFDNRDSINDLDKNNINSRIRVINDNAGEETNRIKINNKNSRYSENSLKKFSEFKSNSFDVLNNINNKNYLKNNFLSIRKIDNYNCCNYLLYLTLYKKKNSNIRYYEDLRRTIISEECMIQNFINIYKILEAINIT